MDIFKHSYKFETSSLMVLEKELEEKIEKEIVKRRKKPIYLQSPKKKGQSFL